MYGMWALKRYLDLVHNRYRYRIGNLALRIFGGNLESRQGHGFTILYEEKMMKKVRRALGREANVRC